MSRAINVDATVEHVIALSAKHNAEISAIEALIPSGTRVVYVKSDDTATMTRAYGARVLTGAVTRVPFRPRHNG